MTFLGCYIGAVFVFPDRSNFSQNEIASCYSSIDKPWLKYYTNEDKAAVFQKMTMYQTVQSSCKEHMEDCCIQYYDNKITYCAFINNVYKAVYNIGNDYSDDCSLFYWHHPKLSSSGHQTARTHRRQKSAVI